MRIFIFLYQWLIAFPILLILTILTAIITIIGCTIGNGTFWGFYPARYWSRLFCFFSLSRVEVKGRENINPKTSYVFVANHQGAYDIFLIYGFLNQPFHWLMKKELRKIPFVGKACESAGHIFVDAAGRTSGMRDTMHQAVDTLKGGVSLVVFPEGSRTYNGKMRRFKKGAFLLAQELNLPVVPLTIDGSFRIMPRTSYQITPGKMILTIHPPIYPDKEDGHNITALMENSYQIISSALPQRSNM